MPSDKAPELHDKLCAELERIKAKYFKGNPRMTLLVRFDGHSKGVFVSEDTTDKIIEQISYLESAPDTKTFTGATYGESR